MANRTIELTLKSNVHGLVSGLKTAQTAASNAGREFSNFTKTNEQAMNTAGSAFMKGGAVAVAGAGLAVKAAMDWESAWAGVMKTNEGTAQQTQALEEDLRALTGVLPATHAEIAGVAEAAGQLGVGIDDVAGFSEVMLNLGETTNLSADEAATALARFSNIMGTSFDDADKLGSTIVALGNNFATTEAEIVGMSMRIAGVGRQMGMTEADVFALATAMSSVGVEAEAGGTAISMVMKKIDSSVREGGESLTGWAEAAGVSAQEFATAWSEDPAQAMVLLTENLGAVGAAGGDINAILADLGVKGIREADTILRLAGASGTLSDALAESATAWDENTALAEEAAVRYETTEAKISIAWNQIKDAAITAGGAILPVIAGIAESIGGVAGWFADLPEPVMGALTALSGVAGATALAGGAFLVLAPRVMDTVRAVQDLRTIAPTTAGVLGDLGKTAGVMAAAIGGLSILSTVHNHFLDGIPTIEEWGQALLSAKENADSLNDMEFSPNEWSMGEDIDSLGAALDNINAGGLRGFSHSVNDAVKGLSGWRSQNHEVEDSIASLDKSMAAAFGSGSAEEAANGFAEAVAQGKEFGLTIDQVAESFPEYLDGLREMATQNGYTYKEGELLQAALGNLPPELAAVAAGSEDVAASSEDVASAAVDAAEGVELVGLAAEGSAEAAEKLADAVKDALDGLREMGVVPRNAQAANDAYQASLDALTESLKENGKTLDDTTDKGRNNRQAMRDHADAALENVAAMAESGASQEELQGQLTSTYAELVKAGEGFGLSSAAADLLARDMLAIPENVDIETWMSESAANVAQYTYDQIELLPNSVQIIADMSEGALNKAFETAAAIEVIPGYKRVDVAVDDQGTPGQVQSRVNAITGKTEYVFVQDDGTTQVVQQQIINIDGKDVPVYVKEDGTVVATQGKINGIHGKTVSIEAAWNGGWVQTEINNIKGKTVRVDVVRRQLGQAALAEGGIAGFGQLPKFSNGGRLPSYGRGTDTILGVGSDGVATAWVDDGEFVTRRASTQKYFGVLSRINRDDPSVRHLAGYAGGGNVGREWSAMSMASAASSSPVSATVDASVIASAVSSAMAGWTPMVNVAGREFHGVMKQVEAQYGGR